MEKPVKITLCRGRGCCPELTLSDEGAKITDDNGGEVELTKVEFEILRDELNCRLS